MKSFSSAWWILIATAALITLERIVTSISGTDDPFWTSPNWELLITLVILISAVLVLFNFFKAANHNSHTEVFIKENPLSHFLFNDTRSAPLWLVVRLYLGFAFLQAGLEKLTGPGWLDGGSALQKFWSYTVSTQSQGAHPAVAYGWYHDFLNFMLTQGWYEWFAPLITYSEIILGIALILGLFTGIAAFGTAILNFSFGLAGVAGVNPLLLVLGITLVLAWKVAGYVGLDRYVLTKLRAPWDPVYSYTPKPNN